jgi:hypothetical protein
MTLDAVSGDTVSGTHWFKRPLCWISTIVFLAGVAALALSDTARYVAEMTVDASTYGITSGKDVNKARALADAVISKITAVHRFVRNSATRPGRPPISVSPGSRAILTKPPVIIVYDIKDRREQDKIIAAVQATMRDQKLRQVDLQFMDHENWIVTEYPKASIGGIANTGERGPELQLRRVRIRQDGIKEKGGQKTITYLPKDLQ